ncbi:MAG: alpha-L-fucosidase [Clostridia bacterium]|nr:alpha-L-fucosidase [Clostridia bacterium]
MNAHTWFREAKFGLMVHWGLYSLLGGEWKGERMSYIGEWIQSRFRIPNSIYHSLASAFNPIFFDADEWVSLAEDAGMKYIVVTSKHHDGFAMYRSKASAFNIADATPFKRDPIEELANACAKKNIKLGLYYSQDLDWSHPHGGGYTAPFLNSGGYESEAMKWTNDWDYPDNKNKDYALCFEEKIKPQVKEILTQYGDLCLIWFDTPLTISPEQSKELAEMVRTYQPNCLINSRIGNGLGDYKSAGDNEIPQDFKEQLFETPATLNDTWGYKSFDNNWKDAKKVLSIKEHLNTRGINYLLNVGPDGLGRIPAPAVKILKEAGK